MVEEERGERWKEEEKVDKVINRRGMGKMGGRGGGRGREGEKEEEREEIDGRKMKMSRTKWRNRKRKTRGGGECGKRVERRG